MPKKIKKKNLPVRAFIRNGHYQILGDRFFTEMDKLEIAYVVYNEGLTVGEKLAVLKRRNELAGKKNRIRTVLEAMPDAEILSGDLNWALDLLDDDSDENMVMEVLKSVQAKVTAKEATKEEETTNEEVQSNTV